MHSQQTESVDFIKADLLFGLDADSSKVFGQMKYEFKVLQDVDSVYIDAVDMVFEGVGLKGVDSVESTNTGRQLILYHSFKKDRTYQTQFNYTAYPKKALYFLKRGDEWNIWTQGQGKYTSHWMPSFDDVNEKVIFNFVTVFDKDYEILLNGQRLEANQDPNVNSAVYVSRAPMSSYLVALSIGKYQHQTKTSESGVPIELYYYPEDSLRVEPTYRYTKEIFDFYEQELGYPYPWKVYRQVPVHDFLYAGMENTSLTIFSDAFVVDSVGYNDKNYVNVNAHEMAHQWFGDLVTAKSGEHHWLQEGFATYYALLAEKQLFGEDHYYFELYQTAQQLGRQDDAGNGTSLLDPKSSSLTFYQRGAWALHALRSQIGNAAFRRAVNTYLNVFEYSSAVTDDFLSIVESQTGEDLSEFKDVWIVQTRFPFEAAIALLREQSAFIVEYMMVNCEVNSSKCLEYLKYGLSDEAKIKVISQRPDLITKSTFDSSIEVRRAISQYLTKIPNNLKTEFESLLNDASYLTVESALYNLWVNFPEDRSRYLSKTRDIQGLSDKNVRLLWLVLHLNTPEFQSDQKEAVYKELLAYTAPGTNADLRIRAFEYLNLLGACKDQCLSNLKQATNHHNWRMVKFAKDQLNKQ
jgi:aminopeptidase N